MLMTPSISITFQNKGTAAFSISFSHWIYEGRSESKERFAIQRYLLIIGKKQFYHTPSPTSPHSHLGHEAFVVT